MISRKERILTDEINSNVTKINANPLLSHFFFDRELTRVIKLGEGGKDCMKAYNNDNILTGMTEDLSKGILTPS